MEVRRGGNKQNNGMGNEKHNIYSNRMKAKLLNGNPAKF